MQAMFLRAVLALGMSLVVAGLLPAQRTISDAEVLKVHRSAILIDTHNDVTSRTVDGFALGTRAADGHTDIPRLKEGGVTAVFFAAYVGAEYAKNGQSAHRALQMIDTIRHDIAERYPNDFVFATTAADIVRAKKAHKMAALIGIEGGHAIEDDVRLLRDYYQLGVRYMTLTHVNTNGWADSSGDINDATVTHHSGLTAAGRGVIAEMNRLGMMVDIAHVSDKTFQDVLEASNAPVLSSHSSCRALSNIPRNMTDDMIRAVAKKGGVIQLNFGCEFLSQKSADSSPYGNPAKFAGQDKAVVAEAEKHIVRATLDDLVAHIDHIKQIAGIDAVGLGSDFDGVTCTPIGLENNSQWPNLTRKLLERGYTAAEIRKIYGANLLRVMREVERVSSAGAR
jgi:membrane dipeptidase